MGEAGWPGGCHFCTLAFATQAPWQAVLCKNDTVTLTEADELDVSL